MEISQIGGCMNVCDCISRSRHGIAAYELNVCLHRAVCVCIDDECEIKKYMFFYFLNLVSDFVYLIVSYHISHLNIKC